jgi:hypothetical protein
VIGGVTCVVVFLAIAVTCSILVYSFMHSKTGQQAMKGINQAAGTAKYLPDADQKMREVYDAIERYKGHTGHYPTNLQQLEPDYLADPNALHSKIDADPDPSHVTFEYTVPTDSTPKDAAILQYKWVFKMTISGMTQVQTQIFKMSLDGQETKSSQVIQSQS